LAGADDYVVKPFSPEELLMRIKAHVRQHDRMAAPQLWELAVGELVINIKRHRATLRGETLELTLKEFQILACLMRQAGEIVSREQIIKEVWGKEYINETSSVAFFIHTIREKIEEDPSHPRMLITVRNVGYRLGE
jgi:DNA-binding response OmpR family regulator